MRRPRSKALRSKLSKPRARRLTPAEREARLAREKRRARNFRADRCSRYRKPLEAEPTVSERGSLTFEKCSIRCCYCKLVFCLECGRAHFDPQCVGGPGEPVSVEKVNAFAVKVGKAVLAVVMKRADAERRAKVVRQQQRQGAPGARVTVTRAKAYAVNRWVRRQQGPRLGHRDQPPGFWKRSAEAEIPKQRARALLRDARSRA